MSAGLNQVTLRFVSNEVRNQVRLRSEVTLSPEIKVAAVLDNLILADSLRAWAAKLQDIQLVAVTATVDELLRAEQRACAVVLLDASLRAEPDTASTPGGCLTPVTGCW